MQNLFFSDLPNLQFYISLSAQLRVPMQLTLNVMHNGVAVVGSSYLQLPVSDLNKSWLQSCSHGFRGFLVLLMLEETKFSSESNSSGAHFIEI